MTNPRWMQAARGAITLGLGLIACADDSAMDASGETPGTTTTGAGSESGASSGETDTTGDAMDAFEPWYGMRYWVDPRTNMSREDRALRAGPGTMIGGGRKRTMLADAGRDGRRKAPGS